VGFGSFGSFGSQNCQCFAAGFSGRLRGDSKKVTANPPPLATRIKWSFGVLAVNSRGTIYFEEIFWDSKKFLFGSISRLAGNQNRLSRKSY
jgi:hypothetical protein